MPDENKPTIKQLDFLKKLLFENNIEVSNDEFQKLTSLTKKQLSIVIDILLNEGRLDISEAVNLADQEEDKIVKGMCFKGAVHIVNKNSPDEIFDTAENLYKKGKERKYW